MSTPPLPRISVVIPTCGRPELLRRVLQALQAQTLPPSAYEIVVVDDGREQQAKAVVGALPPHRVAVTVLHTAGRCGPAHARNRGWRAARAALIAFTDDDTVPAPDWLEQAELALDSRALALWGRIVVPTPARPTDYERNTKGLERAEFATANVLVRRRALELAGGFDERFRSPWREDADLYFTLLAAGGPVRFAPRAVVLHPVRPGRWGECLRQHAFQVFDALLFKKHPRFYRLKILARPPLGYYLTVVATLAALITLLAGQTTAALALAAVALAPVVQLAARRLAGTAPALSARMEVLLTSLAIPFVAVYWRLRGAVRFRVLFL